MGDTVILPAPVNFLVRLEKEELLFSSLLLYTEKFAPCTHAPASAGMECIVLILDRGQELIWGKVLFSFIWSYYKENTIL